MDIVLFPDNFESEQLDMRMRLKNCCSLATWIVCLFDEDNRPAMQLEKLLPAVIILAWLVCVCDGRAQAPHRNTSTHQSKNIDRTIQQLNQQIAQLYADKKLKEAEPLMGKVVGLLEQQTKNKPQYRIPLASAVESYAQLLESLHRSDDADRQIVKGVQLRAQIEKDKAKERTHKEEMAAKTRGSGPSNAVDKQTRVTKNQRRFKFIVQNPTDIPGIGKTYSTGPHGNLSRIEDECDAMATEELKVHCDLLVECKAMVRSTSGPLNVLAKCNAVDAADRLCRAADSWYEKAQECYDNADHYKAKYFAEMAYRAYYTADPGDIALSKPYKIWYECWNEEHPKFHGVTDEMIKESARYKE